MEAYVGDPVAVLGPPYVKAGFLWQHPFMGIPVPQRFSLGLELKEPSPMIPIHF